MIFIQGNVPSSKNSKQWTGKRLISSKQTRRYKELSYPEWYNHTKTWTKLITGHVRPLRIGLYFVRKTRHRFDWVNMCQIIADLMVDHKWIEDDNCDEVVFFPLHRNGQYYEHDKENPGVWITPIKDELKQLEIFVNYCKEIR